MNGQLTTANGLKHESPARSARAGLLRFTAGNFRQTTLKGETMKRKINILTKSGDLKSCDGAGFDFEAESGLHEAARIANVPINEIAMAELLGEPDPDGGLMSHNGQVFMWRPASSDECEAATRIAFGRAASVEVSLEPQLRELV